MHRFTCSTTSSKGVWLPLVGVISLPGHMRFRLDEKRSQVSEHLVPHAIEFFPDSPALHAPGWLRSLHTRWNREQDLSGRKRTLGHLVHVKRDRWIVRNQVAATGEGIVPVIGSRLLYRIEEPADAIGSQNVIDDIAAIVTQDLVGLPALPDHGPPCCKIREETQQESSLKCSITEVHSTVSNELWRQRGCYDIWNDQRFTI